LPLKAEASAEYKKAIEADGEFKNVPLDSRVPDKVVCVSTETSLEEQAELLAFLDKNNDIFSWESTEISSSTDCK
jgi:hypothetical protein